MNIKQLIEAACEAQELYELDDLEAYAEDLRTDDEFETYLKNQFDEV